MIDKLQRSAEEFGIYWRRFKGPHNKVSARNAFLLWVKVLKLIWARKILKDSPLGK